MPARWPLSAWSLAELRRGGLRVRQRPGPKNALGLVKFVFPNDENVYLHDTPVQQLFRRPRRDFSHGCVRVENPSGLAEWALRAGRMDAGADSGGDERQAVAPGRTRAADSNHPLLHHGGRHT